MSGTSPTKGLGGGGLWVMWATRRGQERGGMSRQMMEGWEGRWCYPGGDSIVQTATRSRSQAGAGAGVGTRLSGALSSPLPLPLPLMEVALGLSVSSVSKMSRRLSRQREPRLCTGYGLYGWSVSVRCGRCTRIECVSQGASTATARIRSRSVAELQLQSLSGSGSGSGSGRVQETDRGRSGAEVERKGKGEGGK